nr:hypothetical protein [Tanacetum cinerariifolium]
MATFSCRESDGVGFVRNSGCYGRTHTQTIKGMKDISQMEGENDHGDKGLMSNVVGYATGAAAHKQFSMCLACCKKTCDNAQVAHECHGNHHNTFFDHGRSHLALPTVPIVRVSWHWHLVQGLKNNAVQSKQDKGLMSNVVGYATGAAAHKQFSMCLACCKKTCDNAQVAHECHGNHHSEMPVLVLNGELFTEMLYWRIAVHQLDPDVMTDLLGHLHLML